MRLTPERLGEIHAAVLRLVVDDGYDGLTMDAVAAEARASKATLYRQWGSKETLVVDALGSVLPAHPAVPDTGSVAGDLDELVCEKEPPIEMALVGAILHACRDNAELAASVRQAVVTPQVAMVETILRRGVERGEIDADDPAIDLVLLVLAGPVLLRELVDGEPADDVFMRRYVQAVVLPSLGLTPEPPTTH